MNIIQNHRLANLARQELKRQQVRKEILSSPGEKALDLIFDAPSPATLIQSFPEQDLYYLMHKIGVHDFAPVLAMANADQWEYILDAEVWEDDRMDLNLMTQVFSLLYAADPERLLRWGITRKTEFFEFFLYHNIQVRVREHDEPPPEDFDDYTTLDDKFYFRFPNRKKEEDPAGQDNEELLPGDTPQENIPHEEAPELIETMLKKLAEMDLSVFHGLMLETPALLPAETEEEQFRLKTIRLAEKGFLPAHEAIGIYQPKAAEQLRKRPASPQAQETFDPDQALPPQFFTQFIQGDDLFVSAFKLALQQEQNQTPTDIKLPGELHNELAVLINKIISADRVKLRSEKDLEGVMKKATAFLSLGLEIILKDRVSIKNAAQTIGVYFLEDIFRTGSRAGIQLKTRASAWYENSFIAKSKLPLSFLGETYLGVVGGLLIDRPMFFANYAQKVLYRHFSSVKDIQATTRLMDEIQALDDFLGRVNPDMTTFTQGVLTYKSMMLTLWARNRIGLDTSAQHRLTPMPAESFAPFFTAFFTDEAGAKIEEHKAKDLALWAAEASGCLEADLSTALQGVLYGLIQELEEEYAHVTPDQVDPRFIPHFLLENDLDMNAILDMDPEE